jgi:hypothetical protein
MKDAYSLAGFKWKTMRNDPDAGKRSNIMEIKKPTDPAKLPPFENERDLTYGQEPLTIKFALVMALEDKDTKAPQVRDKTQRRSIEMPFPVLNCLQMFKVEQTNG